MLIIIVGAVLVVLLLAVSIKALRLREDLVFERAQATQMADAPKWFERTLKKKIVLHLKNDQSIEGALMEQTLDGVILRAAELLGENGKRTAMAGETFVPRENIAFSQLDE